MNCLLTWRWPAAAGLTICLLALSAAPAPSAEKPAAPQKVVTIEGITEYRLGNGLHLLLFPDPSTSNVTVNLTVLVGSRHEGYGEAGMAHLLEHMLFKGTKARRNIPKLLRDHGARYNATTSYDRTNFFETLAGTEANLDFALQLEADRFVNSLVRREDLNSEMTVVRSEFEMGENNPDYILQQRLLSVAYEWHNYGKTVIGNRSDIERVPIDRLQAFYHKYYRPDNAVLIVAGKFDPDKALALIGKYFAPLRNPRTPLEKTYTEEPPQDGERGVTLRRVGKVSLVAAAYHIPSAAHPDFAPLQVLADVLDVAPAGRLYEALVETKKAGSVSSYLMGQHDPGLLLASAQVGESGSLRKVRDQMLEIVEGLGKAPVKKDEVERVRQKMLKHYELLLSNSNELAMVLSEWTARGDWRLFFLNRDRIAKVTPEEVNRVAKKYLMRSNRTTGMFIPTEPSAIARAYIPQTPSVEDLVKDYRGKEAVAAGESFDPTPENIEKRTRRAEVVPGVKAALLPKKTRGGVVNLNLTLRYGNARSLAGYTTAAGFLGTMMEYGTKQHTRQQIQDELDKLGAQLGLDGGTGTLSASLKVKRKNLPAALRLLGEMLRQPTFPEKDFEILKRSHGQQLEKGQTEPQVLAMRALTRRLRPYPPEDVRYTPTIKESLERLKALTRDQVVKLYHEQVGAAAGELAVVGDFDPEATLRQMRAILSGWKPSVSYERIPRPAKTDTPGGRDRILTPDKANAIYVAAEALGLKDTDPDYPALALGNFMLGGDPLSSRLATRVRQKEGLSYAVGSQFQADALDKAGVFAVFAICNPLNITKVDRAITDVVTGFLKEGVTAPALDGAKKAYLLNMKNGWSGDGRLAGYLLQNLYEGRTFDWYAGLQKKIRALTPEDIRRAFKKHVRPGRLFVIEAGDFKKKERAEGR